MRTRPYLIYLLTVLIASITMTASEYDIATWQYWIICFCVIIAHITGRECEN